MIPKNNVPRAFGHIATPIQCETTDRHSHQSATRDERCLGPRGFHLQAPAHLSSSTVRLGGICSFNPCVPDASLASGSRL